MIGLIVEADADARTTQQLVDRQLRVGADWLRDAELDHIRGWQVFYWKKIKQLCKQHGIIAQGHFDGTPGAADARAGRRALLLLSKLGAPQAVVLLRDADKQPERRAGLEQARNSPHHHARGHNCGLSEFLDELDTRVVPAFTGREPH